MTAFRKDERLVTTHGSHTRWLLIRVPGSGLGRRATAVRKWARIQRHFCIELSDRRNILGNVSGYELMRRPVVCVIFWTLEGIDMGKKTEAKDVAEKKAKKAEKKAAKEAKRAEKKARKAEKKAAKQAREAAKKATKEAQNAPKRKSKAKSLRKPAKLKTTRTKPAKANLTSKKVATVAKPKRKKVPNIAAQRTQRPARKPAAPVTPATPVVPTGAVAQGVRAAPTTPDYDHVSDDDDGERVN